MGLRDRIKIRTRLRSIVRRIWPSAPKPLILMYHRIAEDSIDPWDLAVSPACFEEQLQVLRRHRYPVRLDEFVERHRAGTLPHNAVALTFDDGYVDNLVAGKPRLAAADIPATVFIVSGKIGQREAFWWDELAGFFSSGDDGASDPSLDKRRAALLDIWRRLRNLPETEREAVMTELRSAFGEDARRRRGRAMTGEELQALISDGLISIGAHTVTHPMLSTLEDEACRHELIESKRACESLVSAPVRAFAYPYGDFNAAARNVVSAAGFAFACSTRPGPVTSDSDIFALPRMHVTNLSGDAFEKALYFASGGI